MSTTPEPFVVDDPGRARPRLRLVRDPADRVDTTGGDIGVGGSDDVGPGPCHEPATGTGFIVW